MLNKKKIRLMSRLAIYDKEYGVADRKKGGYFKWDYIYFRNFWTRAGVFFGCLIIALFYVLNKILVEQVDIMAIDYKLEASKIGFFTVAALILYTIIGTAVAKSEYKRSRERLEAYYDMLTKLDGISENPPVADETRETREAQGSFADMRQYERQYERQQESRQYESQYERRFERRYEPPENEGRSMPRQRPMERPMERPREERPVQSDRLVRIERPERPERPVQPERRAYPERSEYPEQRPLKKAKRLDDENTGSSVTENGMSPSALSRLREARKRNGDDY